MAADVMAATSSSTFSNLETRGTASYSSALRVHAVLSAKNITVKVDSNDREFRRFRESLLTAAT